MKYEIELDEEHARDFLALAELPTPHVYLMGPPLASLAASIRANPPRILPERVGWYEVNGPSLTGPQVRWWTGHNWRLSSTDTDTAVWPDDFYATWKLLVVES